MTDIIHLLPDSVANQIAAGEVIQRPASLVKELIENSIDAGSTIIKIIIKDSGKTLIQVIDNGCGMSETDARMSFERHATSKIKTAADLFAIRTMGFRGEALASIAAVAQVELKTKRHNDELGTYIEISGSIVENQQSVACVNGTSFSVKNLFFNVPARRKFLKSNNAEFRHILDEFYRTTLANPDIAFVLFHNGEEVYNLQPSSLKQRIISVFNKNLNQSLIAINTDTSLIQIRGFVGKPEFAKKTTGEQFFFVNNRFMKHPYFYRAVLNAYEKILPHGAIPSFFLFFTVDTENIDINIHPTKTEIKFTDENAIFQIIQAAVRAVLGKHGIVPSIDFSIESLVEIPQLTKDTEIKNPEIFVNQEFNPFDKHLEKTTVSGSFIDHRKKDNLANWEKLYDGIDKINNLETQGSSAFKTDKTNIFTEKIPVTQAIFFQFKTKYILTPVKSGMMIIDQKRAHERILFEQYFLILESNTGVTQKTLFPETFELNTSDASILREISSDLTILGFDISELGSNTFAINGSPPDIDNLDQEEFIMKLLTNFKECETNIKIDVREKIAMSMAKSTAIWYNKPLSTEQMQNLFDNLFACSVPNFTPDGKSVISIITNEDFDKRFK